MSTFVLIHGAGSGASYWHLVQPRLEAAGHAVVAVDLPCDDDRAGLAEYLATTLDAIGDRTDLVVVAQSMGGFTAPLVADRVPVDLIVLVAAMVPAPGESPGAWWDNTGHAEAMRTAAIADGRDPEDGDPATLFLHDVPPAAIEGATVRTAVRHPVREAVAAGRVARRAHPFPALSRRPVLPRRVPAPGGPGAARVRPR